ncbi:hypothetical protein BGZ95_006679 [Linnemannia exigua]|uniref:F-box domain-containing protein n=1 Tax=Linnemannia exigua TaxID=604196 RepID=A0AAD4H877_9FUNG|nr:hypothetical protein BGZ95_006679 [Linnemannia exigua]
MSTPRPLPTEIFAVIFGNLPRRDLYQCLFVSHLWHDQAEAQLYSAVTIDARETTHFQQLILTLKTRKQFLRRVEWRSHSQEDSDFEVDLLDIFLDYRPVVAGSAASVEDNVHYLPPSPVKTWRSLSCFRFPKRLWKRRTPSTLLEIQAAAPIQSDMPPTGIPGSPFLGPDRPALKHFTFTGDDPRGFLQEMVLFNLMSTTLTTLELHLVNDGQRLSYYVDLERILDTYPHLKDLCLDGPICQYEPIGRDKDSNHYYSSFASRSGPATLHRLEKFTFAPSMMSRRGTDAFTFLQRLGNLKRIRVRSGRSYSECAQGCRTWEFGQALKQHCPMVESVDIDGPAIFWIYGLPILPYDQTRHITSLADQTPAYMSLVPAELVQRMKEDRLRLQLLDQEQEELLEGKVAEPLFPQLKTLIFGQDHSLSFQDLFSLGVQAHYLTHLEINSLPTQSTEPWEVYDKDAPAAAATATMMHLTPTTNARTAILLENRRLQKRRPFTNGELIMFLQLCSGLRYLSLTGCGIPLETLVEGLITMASLSISGRTSNVRPWACEGTLETLKICIDVLPSHPAEFHASAWEHLGRFKNLRSLTVTCSSTSMKRMFLIPTLKFGVEGLFQRQEGGGMNETLEELQLMSDWWEASEGREMVLWLAKSCPRLRKLDLVYNFRFCEYGLRRMEKGGHDAFLEDEDVKQCSIRQINIQTIHN